MSLFLTLLPIYLFGNLHCMGMCGPLVMLLGQHRFRYFYFFGRTLSFALAGLLAGEVGAILNLLLHHYHIPAISSILLGIFIIGIGFLSFTGLHFPGSSWIAKRLANASQRLSLLLLKDRPWSTFLFGFFTLLLPCGQTLVVFSACALYGDAWVGFWNGLAFALLTSPSLLLAMYAHHLLKQLRPYYNKILGASALVVGALALCRGLADLDMISHWIINPHSPSEYHIVIY